MEPVPVEFTVEGLVSYWNVDRDQLISLRSLFSFLQEAAVKHADKVGAGAHGTATRGESWVLQRMSVSIERYPRYEEPLRVVTWSSGIRAFKGYRDFRVYAGAQCVVSASSVWIYLNVAERAICRVPRELVDAFPTKPGAAHCPDLEDLRWEVPAADAPARVLSLRYSDIDSNHHVNNTVYFDLLQTALAAEGRDARPRSLAIQFLREIPAAKDQVAVFLQAHADGVSFGLGPPTERFAHGRLG